MRGFALLTALTAAFLVASNGPLIAQEPQTTRYSCTIVQVCPATGDCRAADTPVVLEVPPFLGDVRILLGDTDLTLPYVGPEGGGTQYGDGQSFLTIYGEFGSARADLTIRTADGMAVTGVECAAFELLP